VTSPDVLETVPPVDALPGRRARPALAVLIVVVVVAGLVGLRWSQRPTGWVTQQTYYSEKQKVAAPGLDVCVQVELTGMMKYERSAAAEAADRHFRHLVVNDPTIETLYYESCARGADLTYLSHVHAAQAWADTEGRALGRNTTTSRDANRGFIAHFTGTPLVAHGVTATGKICLTSTPSLVGQRLRGTVTTESTAPLRPVTVCAH